MQSDIAMVKEICCIQNYVGSW